MSRPLRIALVAEGPTEAGAIQAALGAILAPRGFVLVALQPDATRPDMGTGWGGVLKWCRQAAERARTHGGTVEADPTLVGFDGVVIHLDADVAGCRYADLRPPITDEEAAAQGWRPLPCGTHCPPLPARQDPLFAVLLSWLHPAAPGERTIVCMPALNTGAWLAAAKLPNGHVLLQQLECNPDLEDRMQYLPKEYKVNKTDRKSRLAAISALGDRWPQATARCWRAREFDQEARLAFS